MRQIIATNLVTLITSLTGSYFLYFANSEDNITSTYKIAVDRAEKQDTHISGLQKDVMDLGLEVVRLKGKLADKVDSSEVLQSFIDSFPAPMWIKRQRKDGLFEVIMINNEYVYTFGVSKSKYQGATDFEIWPKELAQEYYNNDLLVVGSRGAIHTKERVKVDGEYTDAHVIKFSLPLPDRQIGVGGAVIFKIEE